MHQVFDDPTAALTFILILFLFLWGLWFITRERKEPPKPDSIWWEFKQK